MNEDYDILTPEEYEETVKSWVVEVLPAKPQYKSWVDDDEWAPAGGGYSYWGYSYGGSSSKKSSNTWAAWWNWWSTWSTWVTYNYDSIEKKMKREKEITKALTDFTRNNSIIAKTYINGETAVVRKSGIYSLSINNVPEWKAELGKLQSGINTWKKLPSSPRVKQHMHLLSTVINHHVLGQLMQLFRNTELAHARNIDKIEELVTMIQTTLNQSMINDEDVERIVNAIPPKVRKELEEMDVWHGWVSSLIDNFTKIKKLDEGLRLTTPPDRFIKTPHISKGKRINRAFLNGTDYRPLKQKIKVVNKKKKLLLLLDGSTSMDHSYDGKNSAYNLWVNFMGDLLALNIFDIEVYQTTSSRVTRVTKQMRDWVEGKSNGSFIRTSGSEWFESLTTRLWSLNRDEDYALVITDMDVPSDAETNLKAFIGSKKHLILSFWKKWKFWCNVRIVKGYKDMANVVTTLIS